MSRCHGFSEAVAQKSTYLAALKDVIAQLEDRGFEAGKEPPPPPPKRELAGDVETAANRALEADLARARSRFVAVGNWGEKGNSVF